MDHQLDQDIERIKNLIVLMEDNVERAIFNAFKSLMERDDALAQKVFELEREINSLDVEIDEDCIKTIALRQPVAGDLRFIITAMKITSDLERIGDLAVNMAERVIELNEEPPLKPYIDLPKVFEIVRLMVRDSLRAFFEKNTDIAYKVIKEDDKVDKLTEQIGNELTLFMIKDPTTINRATKISFLTKYLERIADHAENIARSVIYLVEGKIIRHAHQSKSS
ncbi:MAG: phosphate signaling complex protein PhoU [Proteobacteria bacterium]|nr:phosphate signaling complex protein PhoU [Pseudomonadota bacterium]